MERRNNLTKKITGTGILLAIEMVLQAIANICAIGPVSLNFSAIPIALAGIIYGPVSALILGLISGTFVLLSPSTALFYDQSIYGTVITCLVKGMLSGLIPALLFMLFNKKEKLIFPGVIICSLLVPLINTGTFIGFCFLFFRGIYNSMGQGYADPFAFFTIGFIGWNFLFEILTTGALSPATYKIIKIYKNRRV